VIFAFNLFFAGMLMLTAYSPYIHPTLHPIASCLGLTFPVFLLINVLFLLFWVFAGRYKYMWIPILALLICFPQVRTYVPINFHTERLPKNCFKLLSYNIMAFDGDTKDKNGENPILNYLRNSAADILCLQEYRVSASDKYLTQGDVENALSAYPYFDIQNIGTERSGYSNRIACYSKYPIVSARKLHLKSGYNGSVVYEIVLDGDTVTLINNHLESNKLTKQDKVVYEDMLASPKTETVKSGARLLIHKLAEASAIRAVQADSVARVVATSTHPHIVVCGDFNDTPISYTHRVIGERLNDAFAQSGNGLGISFNQNKFYFRIDHILADKNFKAYNCTVDRSIDVSDHYPVWCYLKKIEKKQ
jgi:endonuclease/exonuclease/phosphatase family metal-dependent hydrolase